MKIYPKHDAPEGDRGFTEDEIRRGIHWLYADVTCEHCNKVQSYAMASSNGDRCIKCDGPTK